MAPFQDYLRALKREIDWIEPQELKNNLDNGSADSLFIIDVREQNEYVAGHVPGCTWIPRGFLEQRIENVVRDRDAPVVVYCASSTRSAMGVNTLHRFGYKNVRCMSGGFTAWKTHGFAFDTAESMTPEQQQRYSRHTMLPEVGEKGQIKLLKSKVLCIGAGGLGSPSSLYLAAAGIGTIGIIDDDVVDASNLQRQILHTTERVGMPKVDSAELTLTALNPDVEVVKYQERLSSDNIFRIIERYDVIIDGADNFPTRYLLNDAALKLGKHVVHSSIFRFEGQITTFLGSGEPCYRCLYPEPPPPEEAPSCGEAGVLGVLPGIMGVLQATEAVKLLLGAGRSLSGRLLVYDALGTRFHELKLRRDPKCPTCGDGVDRSAIELIDYHEFCAGPAH